MAEICATRDGRPRTSAEAGGCRSAARCQSPARGRRRPSPSRSAFARADRRSGHRARGGAWPAGVDVSPPWRGARVRGDERLSLFPEQAAPARCAGRARARRHRRARRVISTPSSGCASSAGNIGRWRIGYPRLFPLAALHRLNMPAGVAFIERMLRHFRAALPDDRLAAQAFRIFGYYVIGAALDETAGYAAGPSAAEPVSDDFIARECPRLAAAAPYFKRPYFESTFELGLGDDAERHRRPSRHAARRTSRARQNPWCGPRRDAPTVRCTHAPACGSRLEPARCRSTIDCDFPTRTTHPCDSSSAVRFSAASSEYSSAASPAASRPGRR